ncbi:LADA_0D07646g1_1 [Lachancea dasiensis]|uniref:LADA_0D07646g1_1 n=1 Tax=Lachancea dasiensis TaxID=1072105 RepID=A0A1G4J6K1_9SACH|nr:LADA_0D07646g1_1 [Lachancea dasiensis]
MVLSANNREELTQLRATLSNTEQLDEMTGNVGHSLTHNHLNGEPVPPRTLDPEAQGLPQRAPDLPARRAANNEANLWPEVNLRFPDAIERRRYLRAFLRNLIILDHLLLMVLFPFSLYNVLRILLTEVTFSNNDFIVDIATYCRLSNILSSDGKSVVFFRSGFGLLGKFHNIIVFYSAPIFVWITSKSANGFWITRAYTTLIKSIAVTLYMLYGVGTSAYVSFASFFFALCLLMTGFRRYKGVAKIMGQIYRSTTGVF